MNSELLTLQDLEPLISKSNCACHFINPNKTRIILWKERSSNSELSSKEEKDQAVTYYLRLGIQKFISYPLTDKNNEVYWKFKVYEKPEVNSSELEAVAKFHQRQTKAESYAKPNNSEQSVDEQSN